MRFLSLSIYLQLGIQLLCLTKYCPKFTSQKYIRADLSTCSSIRGMATLCFSGRGTCVFAERQTGVSRHFFSFPRHQDMELTGQTPKVVIIKDAKKLFFVSSRNWISRFSLPYDPNLWRIGCSFPAYAL